MTKSEGGSAVSNRCGCSTLNREPMRCHCLMALKKKMNETFNQNTSESCSKGEWGIGYIQIYFCTRPLPAEHMNMNIYLLLTDVITVEPGASILTL